MKAGNYICAYVDDTTGRTKFVKYKNDEVGYVDSVRLIGEFYLSPPPLQEREKEKLINFFSFLTSTPQVPMREIVSSKK